MLESRVHLDGSPAVSQVYFSGSNWQPAFKQHMAAQGLGLAAYGFAVPGGAAQLTVLPWVNLDQVSVTFTAVVNVDAGALTIRGAGVSDYEPDFNTFAYDADTHTATWHLPPGQSFGNDRIRRSLDADLVSDPDGVGLDGDWINPAGAAAGGDAYPSGDGTTGGDFLFRVNVLPGDVTRNGAVLADDFSDVKRRFFKSTTNVGSGDTGYSVFDDVDGNGSIVANDFSEVKRRFFTACRRRRRRCCTRLRTGPRGSGRTGFRYRRWPRTRSVRPRGRDRCCSRCRSRRRSAER